MGMSGFANFCTIYFLFGGLVYGVAMDWEGYEFDWEAIVGELSDGRK